MIYTDKPYTNILKGSHSDAKLKYFNIRDYFQTNKKTKKYFLSARSLYKYFNIQSFIKEF
jgi:hypothetical protein